MQQFGPFASVRELAETYKEEGRGHFFDKGTMQFFNSRIHWEKLYGGRIFVTSEQCDLVEVLPRDYGITICLADGRLWKVGERHRTSEEAHKAAEKHAQALKDVIDSITLDQFLEYERSIEA